MIDISDEDELTGMLYNRIEKKVYKLGNKEYKVWKVLSLGKNKNSVYKICNFYSKKEIDDLIDVFSAKGLLNYNKSKKIYKWYEIKIGICYPEKILNKYKYILIKISKFTNVLFFLVVMIAAIVLPLNVIRIIKIIKEVNYLSLGLFSGLLMIFSLIIHECFHAIEAKRWGGKIPEFGIKFYFGMPVAYTSICGMEKMGIKEKVLTMLAGMKINALIFFSCIILLIIVPRKFGLALCGIALSNLFPVLGNLSIYYKFDLYYICSILNNESELIDKRPLKKRKYIIYNFLVQINNVILIIIFVIIVLRKILNL